MIRKKRMNDELKNTDSNKNIEMMNTNAINYGNVAGNASPSSQMHAQPNVTSDPQRLNSASHLTSMGPFNSGITADGSNVIDDNVTNIGITNDNTITAPGTAGYINGDNIPSLPDDMNIINTGDNNEDIFAEADGENEENELYFHTINTSGGPQNSADHQQTLR